MTRKSTHHAAASIRSASTPDFRALFESAPGLYLVLTPDLKIIAVSDAYLRATMTERENIIGRDIFDVFPDNPDDPNATGVCNLRASLGRVLTASQADAMPVQKYDVRRPVSEGGCFEERYWSPLNAPVIGADGRVAYIIHRVEDVTEFISLKKLGRERDQMTEALRTRAEQMESEIYLRAQELSRVNEQLRTANAELARLYNQIGLLMAQADDELRMKSAEEFRPDAACEPMTPETMLTRVGQLIRGYRQLQEQLRQSQKMEAIGRLAGGVAHDFNNLLTVITGYASLVRDQLAETAVVRNIEEVQRAAERAAKLTGQLLTFSRRQVMQHRIIDLNAVVSGMEELLRRLVGENIQVSTALDPRLETIRADPGQVEQVIMNLAVNARDAMPTGGTLLIQTQRVQVEPDSEIRSLRSGTYAMLSVSDTGRGMDAETLAHMFEPFFTTKEVGKGTGLGLSTAYGIVEQSRGAMTVRSRPGEGAIFRVYLPIVAHAHERPAPQRLPRSYSRTGTVLVVEDETPLRTLVHNILADAGYRVLDAANGQEALQVYEQSQERIDLLLTDVIMPGMTGPELVAQLRVPRNDLIVLYMSGYDRDLMGAEAREANTNFLPKPFTPQSLLSKIGELLGVGGDVGYARS